MNSGEYFENAKGHGILATADSDGKVNAAMYARPYFTDENTAVFIMAERLIHANIRANPWATYLFIEAGQGDTGKRLYLKKIKEQQNDELPSAICRKCDYSRYKTGNRYIVHFAV
ncbi:pyridoxamine 5'-phosphate oxidase family protein [Chloroflexota bacterium]